jgi:hypothetical protein
VLDEDNDEDDMVVEVGNSFSMEVMICSAVAGMKIQFRWLPLFGIVVFALTNDVLNSIH